MLLKKTDKKKKQTRNLARPACQNAITVAISNDVEKKWTHQILARDE